MAAVANGELASPRTKGTVVIRDTRVSPHCVPRPGRSAGGLATSLISDLRLDTSNWAPGFIASRPPPLMLDMLDGGPGGRAGAASACAYAACVGAAGGGGLA